MTEILKIVAGASGSGTASGTHRASRPGAEASFVQAAGSETAEAASVAPATAEDPLEGWLAAASGTTARIALDAAAAGGDGGQPAAGQDGASADVRGSPAEGVEGENQETWPGFAGAVTLSEGPLARAGAAGNTMSTWEEPLDGAAGGAPGAGAGNRAAAGGSPTSESGGDAGGGALEVSTDAKRAAGPAIEGEQQTSASGSRTAVHDEGLAQPVGRSVRADQTVAPEGAAAARPAESAALPIRTQPGLQAMVATPTDPDIQVFALPTAEAEMRAAAMAEPRAAAPATFAAPASRQVADALVISRGETTEILLSPEELGRVRMIIGGPDRAQLMIWAERTETMDLLRRNAEELSADLAEAGLGSASMEFRSDGEWQPPQVAAMNKGDNTAAVTIQPLALTTRYIDPQRRIDIRV